VDGRVILYADHVTGSMERAMAETSRRREKQLAYNTEHGITPATIKRQISDVLADVSSRDSLTVDTGDEETPHLVGHNLAAYVADLEQRMRKAAEDLEFEEAARMRDEIKRLEGGELGLPASVLPTPSGRAAAGRPGTRTTMASKRAAGRSGKPKMGRR